MSEWKEVLLKNVLGDKGYIRGPFGSSLKRGEMQTCGIPVYEQKNAIYSDRTFRFFIGEQKFKELSRFQVRTNDLIISCSGTVGKISIIKDEDPKGIISQALLILRPDTLKINLLYLYYFLSSKQGFELLTQVSHGSVQINIAERKVVQSIPLLLPPLAEQKAIADVLSSLNNKIDLLHRQNKTLEAMAEALFRQWLVEEADTIIVKLGDIIELFDNKRIPLSSTERDKKKSGTLYPYYGAAKIMDYINDYIFDGEFLLLGEDGTVQTNDGFPILQMATGKFWVNNHAHVINAKEPYSNFMLYSILKMTSISHIVTGAVQPKINQENLKSLEIEVPGAKKIKLFVHETNNWWEKILFNNKQIMLLEKFRNTILPKLLNGEMRVKL